jgi:hypothetical protein
MLRTGQRTIIAKFTIGFTPLKRIDLEQILKIIIKFSITEKKIIGKNIFFDNNTHIKEIVISVTTK